MLSKEASAVKGFDYSTSKDFGFKKMNHEITVLLIKSIKYEHSQ